MQTLIFCVLMALAFFSIGAAVFLTVAIVGSLVRLLIALMPYAVAIGLSFLLWGCGDVPSAPLVVETHNPDFGAEWAQMVIEATETELGDTIDTDGMTIRIVPEVYPCPTPDAIACHRPGLIILGAARREMALAHELLHAYFLQTVGNSDHYHARPEFEAVPEAVRSKLLD